MLIKPRTLTVLADRKVIVIKNFPNKNAWMHRSVHAVLLPFEILRDRFDEIR